MTMQLIETIEVGAGGAASIEFTSIPQDGSELLCKISSRDSGAGGDTAMFLSLNGSSSDFNGSRLQGYGTTVARNNGGIGNLIAQAVSNGSGANIFSGLELRLFNYTGNTFKSYACDTATPNSFTGTFTPITHMAGGTWDNTAAVTTLTLTTGANFMQHTTASLYKIF